MSRIALCVATMAFALASSEVFGAAVDAETAKTAAGGFLAKSSVAGRILAGRSVDEVDWRGGVWIAHLAPSGYIELAGSTKCAPVLSFSAEDFVEPEAGSPLAAKLLADGEMCEAKEADESAADNPQWQTLLAAATASTSASTKKRLLRASSPSATTSDPFVDSFIGARWAQGSPMSDLTPRRSPCGCVATAAGQEFRYWRWPYRFESVDTFTHTLVDANGDGVPYVIRLDGRVAIDWDKVAASGGSSTPYAADKTTAYNTALLTAWMQEFGGIVFKAGAGSGSRKVCSSAETAWYEAGPVMSRGRDGYDNLWAAVTNDLAYGSPIQINTPVHQMVIDGYAVDNAGTSSEVDWINTNYGWGNPTSWENFDTVTTTGGGAGVFADFQTGFRPMKIVQFEPVPRVSNSTVPLTWHIAPCYTNKINGFTIQIDKFTDATSLIDDFSASAGTASSDKFKVEDGYLGGYPAIQDSTYTYPNTYFATSSASLTFNTKSRYMNGHTATVEVKANSGSWETVYTIALTGGKNTSYDTPVEHDIDLSAYAGKAIQLRFRLYCTWAGYTAGGSADFRIDDVLLTGVKGVATTMNTVLACDATYPSVYSYTAEELESGSSYAFTVAPFMSDLSDGRTNTVTTTIGTPAAAPTINSVSSIAGGIDLVQEGFFIECARGAVNDIAVTCSESTTSLSAFPSHLSILPDEKVTVEKSGNVFTVHVDATDMIATKKFWDGDMLILTLVATNDDGTEAYKNLMLRFNSMRQVLGGDYEIADTSVASAVWFCGDTTLDAKGQNVTFAANAFMGSGCTVTLTDSVGGGSFTFAGLNGFTGTLAFSGSLDVTLPEDMSGFSGTLGITDGTYTLNRDLPATATLELGESMPTVYLNNATIAGTITGYGEVYVTSGTCAVTGSIGAGAFVMLSGGTLELAQGLESRVGQTGGTLKIQLTPYQTAYGYSALIQNYASGTILLVDPDGNEITPTISGDPAVIYPPTLATTTASYVGNANVWTGTTWFGENYTDKWSNGLPSDGDYVIFNVVDGDGLGGTDYDYMYVNLTTPTSLGYVIVTGDNQLGITVPNSSSTSAMLTADVLENFIPTKLGTDYFKPTVVVPRAQLIIANGMKFSCDIDYTLATNLMTYHGGSTLRSALQYSDQWEGTVVITNYTAAGLNPGEYGNANSVVRLSGVEGWLANNKEYLPTVELVDYGTKPALKWNDGSASSTVIFDAISGDGTFETARPNNGGKESVVIKDVKKFTGSFNLAAKKVAIADAMPSGVDASVNNGRLFVCKAATVASGANWSANGGIHLASGCDLTVNGTLDATSMLTNDSDNATLTLDGGVLKISSALKGGCAPTLNFKSGTYQITADISESSTVNFCADAGEYTTLDANGHKLTLSASFFSGSGDIYLTSSAAGGSFVITGISTDYTGTIYAEESLKVTYPDDLSTQGGIINIAGATLAYSSAKLGNVRVDEGGTLTVSLTDEQAMSGFDASSLVTLAGGVVEFVDSYGTTIVSSSESATYTRPASYTLAPSATAVWVSGEFEDAAADHGGYVISTTMAGEVNSAGNIVIGGDSSYIGATLNLSTVTNCTKASVLVKFKSSLTGAPAANAAIMGVISSDGYPISPICTTEGGTEFTGAYLNKDSSYALVTGNYPFSTTPTYPSSGSGYMLFSYQSDQGSSAINGTAFYIGDTIETMGGGNRNNLQWRQKTLTSFYIGGPASTTIPTWKGLEIEAVALFVDEWYAPADVKWYEFPAAQEPEEPEYAGPAPTAVWVAGEFGDHKSAHAGCQISLNGNTTNELGQIVIGDDTALGATIGIPEDKGKQVTMLVKYSIPSGSHADNSAAAALNIKNGYELGALADSGESALKGYWLDTRNNGLTVTDGDFAFSSPAPSVPQSGYILISNWAQLPNTDGHGTAVYTGETIATLSGGEKTGLRFTGDNNCITNVSIGGPTKAGAVPWAGMVIEGVALFDSWVTPDDITGYKFPEQGAVQPVDDDEYLIEPAAVWVNDFKTSEKNGYTLSVSGTTEVLDDTFGGTITIGDAGAAIGIPANTRQYTMLVKYAAAPAQSAQNFFTCGSFVNGNTTVDIGLMSSSAESSALTAGYDNGSAITAKSIGKDITPSPDGGYLLVAHDASKNISVYAGDTLEGMANTSASIEYLFSNWNYTGLAVGGPTGARATNKCGAWSGLVIEKVVIFDGYYTLNQIVNIPNPEEATTLEIGANATWNFTAGTTRTYENIGTLSASGTISVTNETLGAGVYKLAEWTTAQKKSTGYGYVGTLSTPGLVPGLTAELVYGAKAIYLRVYDETMQSQKPTLKIWPYGDSITEGFNASNTKANYRVLLAQKLALLGYNVEMVGCYDKIQTATEGNLEFMDAIDPSGAAVPDKWKWHSSKHGGTIGVTTATNYKRSAMVENVDTLAVQAGNPDIILLHGGINDLYASDQTPASVFANLTNTVSRLVENISDAKIVISTCLYANAADSQRKTKNSSVVEPFNTLVKEFMDSTDIPTAWQGRVYLADLNTYVQTYRDDAAPAGITVDNLHPDWLGHDQMAEGWLSVITNVYASADGQFPSNTDPEHVEESALGAAAKAELADYRDGFTLAQTITVASTNAPTVVSGEGPATGIGKVGYFVEYVRADNEAHKWVWVDMDAPAPTLADLGLPTANHQQAVTSLHVYSNHNGIDNIAADDDTATGWIEFSPYDYTQDASGTSGAPTAHGNASGQHAVFDWNDTLGESGSMGSMQVFRKAPATGRPAQLLFAYNNWQSDSTAAEFGVGNFAQHFWGGAQTLDYTYTKGLEKLNAAAYRVKRIEIWTQAAPETREVYYKSGYWGAGGTTTLAVTLADGTTATNLREGDTIVIDNKSSTDIYFGPLPEFANKIRVSRNVVFSSGANVPAMLNGAEISVDDGCAVTIKRQWNDIKLGSFTIDGTSAVTLDNNGQSLTIDGTLTCNAPITIASGKTVSVGATGSLAGTYSLSGEGTLAFAAMPDSALSFDSSWTGTVELPAFQASGQTLTNYVVNGTSKLKLNGITGGYLMWEDLDMLSEVILAGDFILTDMSERNYSFAKISGTGNISLTPGTYALTSFTIGEYSATGAVTNNMPNTAIAITTLALPSGASVAPGTKLLSTGGTGSVTIGKVTVGGEEQTNLSYLKRNDGIYVAVTPENIDDCDASGMTDEQVAELVFTVKYTPDGGTETTANYTGILAKDANGEVALNPSASVDGVSVTPELDDEAEAAYDARGETLQVKAIPGLWYQTIYGDALTSGGVGGDNTGATEAVQATQKALTLEAPKEGAVRFYQIRVAPKE